MTRLTAADVRLVVNNADTQGGRQVCAHVASRGRLYIVDLNPLWGHRWYCSCGRAPTCAHIRATKEAIGQ